MANLNERAALWVGQRLNRRGFVGHFGRVATLATFAAAGARLAAPGIAHAQGCCSACLASCQASDGTCYCCSYNLGTCPSSSCSGPCDCSC